MFSAVTSSRKRLEQNGRGGLMEWLTHLPKRGGQDGLAGKNRRGVPVAYYKYVDERGGTSYVLHQVGPSNHVGEVETHFLQTDRPPSPRTVSRFLKNPDSLENRFGHCRITELLLPRRTSRHTEPTFVGRRFSWEEE